MIVGPIPVASIGSGPRSASSSVLVSTIIIIALSHLVVISSGAVASSVFVTCSVTGVLNSTVIFLVGRERSICYFYRSSLLNSSLLIALVASTGAVAQQ